MREGQTKVVKEEVGGGFYFELILKVKTPGFAEKSDTAHEK